MGRLVVTSLLVPVLAYAVIIDRIAIIVGNSIIKDSDIDRDIRAADFLNGRPLNLSAPERKGAAARLIDQVLIGREIRIGDYPRTTFQEADQQLKKLESQRFKSQASLEQALNRYGLTMLDLRAEFTWQLTVLRFIDQRFKPAVLVTDKEVNEYLQKHVAALRREHPGASETDLHGVARDLITGEQVNKLFFDWLDEQRKEAKIQYLEESLR